jgi:phenylalanyl-tRNA synthetase beta chain
MKLCENWLKEWVQVDVDIQALADELTMAGLEVDGVEPVAADFTGVVVGHVLSVSAHPDAEKLQVCEVDVSGDEPLQIVCGAKNVAAGMKVPTAVVGAKLPGNYKIKKAKLRGVASFGMLCGASEIDLAEQSDGLMVLPENAPIGRDIREYLDLSGSIIEVDLTPNRGDCLSVRGVSREVGVLFKKTVNAPEIHAIEETIADTFPVEVVSSPVCPRYLGRVIRNVRTDALTPLWMQEKLRRAGLRSISPLVDITNFILLELGQPMHAFDLDKLVDGIVVREANEGEKVVLLDGQEKTLSAGTTVIADGAGPVAIAGIMGGERTAVDLNTTHLFLECAFFAPIAIAGKGRHYGVQTDSSHRFERGVDWQLQRHAMTRATQLIVEIAGGEAGPITEVMSDEHLPVTQVVQLRQKKISQLLGFEIERDVVTDMLVRLEMQVEQTEDGWRVQAPSHRFDIEIEADLIEEIGRIYGYNNLPVSRIEVPLHLHAEPESELDLQRVKDTLVARGFQEVVTYSFVHPDQQKLVDPLLEGIHLANPISQDLSVMRTNLWGGLLQTMSYNKKRQQPRMKLFESGLRFYRQAGEICQDARIAGLLTGNNQSEQWSNESRPVDFFDIKSEVMSILSLTACAENFKFTKGSHPALHPGQSSHVLIDGRVVGWVGLIHPELERKLGLGQKVFVFELALGDITYVQIPKFEPLSKFPAVRRDISIIVDENVEYEDVSSIIQNNQNTYLKQTILFDVYRGENLGDGQKSYAIGLVVQDESDTLTDNQVDDFVAEILKSLADKLGAILRD